MMRETLLTCSVCNSAANRFLKGMTVAAVTLAALPLPSAVGLRHTALEGGGAAAQAGF